MRVDTVVVGAGPAGTAAGSELAKGGADVLVVDRAVFPRDKCCGDGLTTLALRELERLGLDPAAVRSWTPVDRVAIVGPSGREITYPLPAGPGTHAAIARRQDLDAALVDLARAHGAEVREGHALKDARAVDGGVELEIEGIGSVRARHVVGADGMWSPLRRALGMAIEGYRGEIHAVRQYVVDVAPRAAEELAIWFEPDLLPGYSWSFPLADGTANVGLGVHRGGRVAVGDLKKVWLDFLERPHIRSFLGPDARPEAPMKAWPIPARVGRAPLTGPDTLFVGDAATVTDPMTGEGIGQALLTGRVAAESILAGGDVTGRYEAAVRAELVADDRMARALLPVLARPFTARAALRITALTPWTRRNVARWMFEDYPRALVLTPRRWHRGVFTGPGAYQGHARGGPNDIS